MSSLDPQATFEICPKCSQPTAPEHFRTVGETRLCALCTHRAGQDVKAREARALDARYHGGLGWLWKHVAWVAFITLAGTIIRLIILRAINDH